MTAPGIAPEERLAIVRTIDLPRARVFAVWTEGEHLARWWGPAGWAIRVIEVDVRPGGVLRYGMTPPGGAEMFGKFAYREVSPPERLVWVNSFCDEEGNVIPPPVAPTWPRQILITATFTEQGGTTTITLHGSPLDATEEELATYRAMRPNVQLGYAATVDRLEAHLQA